MEIHQVKKFLQKFYLQVKTPLASKCLALLEAGEWVQLQQLSIAHPATYGSAHLYKWDAAVISIVRKLRLPGDDESRRKEAVNTFWAAEAQCMLTNRRLQKFQSETQYYDSTADLVIADFIKQWQKNFKRALGKASYALDPLFSGGSTLSDVGKLTTIPDKMSSLPTASPGAVGFYSCFTGTPQHEAHPAPEVVRGNRFFTVPKDSFKDRGCCVEPSVNVSLQLAVGKKLKNRYRKVYGVDLARDSQELHRRLACLASTGDLDLATIDLSNASDTVAKGLIRLLLPDDWYELLNSLRCTHTKIEGRLVYLEKFSSMGNGFTFELETLLFRTLCETLDVSYCHVFGDDIIVSRERSGDVIAALRYFGFTPNEKKTFCEGPFRESCGGDFFDGVAVRPHFLEEIPDGPTAWIALANGLRRLDPSLERVSAAWRFCLDQIPIHLRACRGPAHLGDVVIHDPEASPIFREYRTLVNGIRHKNSPTWFWRTITTHSRSFPLGSYWSYRVATAAASLGVPPEVVPRDSITGYSVGWVAAHGLTDHSWWCGSNKSQ